MNPVAMSRLCVLLALSAAADPALADSLKLISAARVQTHSRVTYDGSYRRIPYPMGDVPADRGVCTDVVIRAYRSIGIDLQELVHKDMQRSFDLYPQQWGMNKPDTNIDHRRVPNLQKFFDRAGAKLDVTRSSAAFQPGDLDASRESSAHRNCLRSENCGWPTAADHPQHWRRTRRRGCTVRASDYRALQVSRAVMHGN